MEFWGIHRVLFFIGALFWANFVQSAPRTKSHHHECPKGDWKNSLVVHHIAVGQGDATFLRTPSGTTVLIDAGLPGRGKADVVPTLKTCYQLESLDYVVLTHFDQDHHGGLAQVLKHFKVGRALYDPGDKMYTGATGPKTMFSRFKKAADATGKRKVPAVGRTAIPDKSVDFTIVSVNGKIFNHASFPVLNDKGKPKDDNAISISLLVRYGTFDYFIGGDLTGGGNRTPDLESAVARTVGDVDVLHANHHGSETSSNDTFLKTLEPEHVVISVGNGGLNKGRYHHPETSVLERLDSYSFVRNVFQTAKGESLAPPAVKQKVTNMNGDVILIAEKHDFLVQGFGEFRTDGD
ncbi:MAG: MBL fold metallo-hydrolase [Bdellovibrionales bacterium]|nr:MBL fold metallo-hydrolase [Bdellovibrionales bacterium]